MSSTPDAPSGVRREKCLAARSCIRRFQRSDVRVFLVCVFAHEFHFESFQEEQQRTLVRQSCS